MSIDLLKNQIKDNKLANLYLFYGPEEYLKKYYLETIEKRLIPDEGMKTLNKTVLEGKMEPGKILDACETLPVFSEKRLVIIRNSGAFKGKSKAASEDKKGKPKSDDLLEYVQSLPEHICLVFYEEEIDKRVKLVDAIKKNGLIVEFAFQKPPELVKWVVKVVTAQKKQMDPLTASLLVDNSEQGMNEILTEINKLVLFVGDRAKINQDDIEKVCIRSIKTRIFDLTDAIAEKDRVKALKLLDDMVVMKEPMQKILYMINRHFRHVLQMKVLMSEGVNSDQAASKIGITPYAAGKVVKQSRGFTIQDLKNAIQESLEYDLAIKTGKLQDRLAAELLIAKLSS
ncbi:MAG: DNA polymerase III subunit delta [Clostridia bacterium]|nr:DNA polymerase III subunit delta [Clostridia bacterium]